MLNKTKIIATVGPSCKDEKTILNLIKSGVNVFRINLSHTDKEQLKAYITTIQKVRKQIGLPVGIMIDTRGPEIRIGKFENKKVLLQKNQIFSFVYNNIVGNDKFVSINQKKCVDQAKIGSTILADDGKIKLKIINKINNELICKVIQGGELEDNKSLWFKNQYFDLPYLNKQDQEDIKLAIEIGIEYISASFVRNVDDIKVLKSSFPLQDNNIKVIAKIENIQGLKNLESIIKNCDGVMVARGDLGVEVNFEKLPIYQRQIINIAHKYSKISIVATEMLESMIYSNRPTRAEVSDVSKAVFDGASAVMLSGETAMGISPTNCVKVMSKILKEAEKEFDYYYKFKKSNKNMQNLNDLIVDSAVNASFFLNCKAIVTYTSEGRTALKLSSKFCKVPIVAITENLQTYNVMSLFSNTYPIFSKKNEDIFNQAQLLCLKHKITKEGDCVIITTGNSDSISNVLKFQIVQKL